MSLIVYIVVCNEYGKRNNKQIVAVYDDENVAKQECKKMNAHEESHQGMINNWFYILREPIISCKLGETP